MAGSYLGEFIMTDKIRGDKVIFTSDINHPNWDGWVKLNGRDLADISDLFYQSQLKDIYAPTILNHIQQDKIGNTVSMMINKLSSGGHIIIGGIDAYLLSKQMVKRNINLIELNKLLFYKGIESLVDIREVTTMIKNLNIHIITIDIDESECRFTIKGIKR